MTIKDLLKFILSKLKTPTGDKNVTYGLLINIKNNKLMINQIVEIGAAVIPEGKRVFTPFLVQPGGDDLIFQLDSTQHLNTYVYISWYFEQSLDDGPFIRYGAGGGRTGAAYPPSDPGDPPSNVFFTQFGLANPNHPNKRLRLVMEVIGGSITTGGGSITLNKNT